MFPQREQAQSSRDGNAAVSHVLFCAGVERVALQRSRPSGGEAHFAQAHDMAYDDDGGGLEIGAGNICRRATERRFEDLLILQRRVAHERDGFICAAAVVDQQVRDGAQMRERHVEDDDRRAFGDGRPVEIFGDRAARHVAGDEGDGVIDVAVGDRDAGIAEAADAGGDARHQTEGDARIDQRQRLFAAAAEDEGVAALQAQHALAGPRQFDEARRDVALLRARLAAALAGILKLRPRPCELQNGFVDQRVVDHDVGLLQRVERVERQQARIARPGADQPHPARLEDRQRQRRRRVVRDVRHPLRLPVPGQGYDFPFGHFTYFFRCLTFKATIACK